MLKISHSRGILIFAVGLLLISLLHSLCPLKRHSDICCGTATYIASHSLRPLKRHSDICRGTIQLSAANSRPTRCPTQEVTQSVAWWPSHCVLLFTGFNCTLFSFSSTYLTILLIVVEHSLSCYVRLQLYLSLLCDQL